MAVSEAEFAVLTEKFDQMKLTLDRIEKLLDGNGTPGFVTRLTLAEQSILRLQGTWNATNKFFMGLVTVLVIAMGGFFWAVMTHTVTIATKIP